MTRLATLDELPALLREPPWASGQRAPEPPRLDLPPLDATARLTWPAEESERLRLEHEQRWKREPMSQAETDTFLDQVGVRPEAREPLRAGAALQPRDFVDPPRRDGLSSDDLERVPPALALALWNSVPATRWYAFFTDPVPTLLLVHGEACTPGLVGWATRRPVQGLRAARWIDSPALAAVALSVRRRTKTARPAATEWLLRHPATSAQVLLRQLFGADDPAREDARFSLHELADQGLRQALDDAARALGSAAQEAIAEQLATDPLLRLPARLPKLPAFFDPTKLHRPRLRSNAAALPDDAMRHLGTMLAISRPEQPYAGIAAVRAACASDSLAAFAWDLFEAWWAADAPSKDAWAFVTTLGLLGDDSTMHRLGPRAMRWAKENMKARALSAVDLLGDAGSDAALLHLSNLAERCKSPAVSHRASALVDAVAEQRGLTRTELADRLVPTLGLDDGRALDFGPRQFEIAIDETLTPYVKDAQGARLKDLPKPRQSDDAVLAEAASLRFKQLKKDLKSLAKVQLARLEQAMIEQRRWPLDDFRTFFVRHPITRALAARLVWSVAAEDGSNLAWCRIAEDGTLADASDRLYEPPPGAQLGLAHPLSMTGDARAALTQVFADYETLQPFPQLTRETFEATPDEIERGQIDRVVGHNVPVGVVIALLDRGWLRGDTEEGGMIPCVVRPLGASSAERGALQGPRALLELDPGMFVGQLSMQPRQILGKVLLRDANHQPLAAAKLDLIAISELLRDLNRLAPFEAKA